MSKPANVLIIDTRCFEDRCKHLKQRYPVVYVCEAHGITFDLRVRRDMVQKDFAFKCKKYERQLLQDLEEPQC